MQPVTFNVNPETCIRCGLCMKDCLERIIEMDDLPFIPERSRSKCIHCGHCQALCPTASITLDGHASDTLEGIPERVDEKIVQGLIKRRRSVREFRKDEIDPALLERIIDMASYAPTATNSREISYLVVNGREQVEKLLQATIEIMQRRSFFPNIVSDVQKGWDRIFRDAPCIMITHAPEKFPLSASDCATVLATLELALPSFNLASCWAGFFTVVCGLEIPDGLPIPAGNRIYGGLVIGAPAVSYKRIPFRTKPKIEWIKL